MPTWLYTKRKRVGSKGAYYVAGGVVGAGVGAGVVRAHVGVRVGAARRRAGHARLRGRHAGGLRHWVGRLLLHRQHRAGVPAARRLPRTRTLNNCQILCDSGWASAQSVLY